MAPPGCMAVQCAHWDAESTRRTAAGSLSGLGRVRWYVEAAAAGAGRSAGSSHGTAPARGVKRKCEAGPPGP